MMYGRSVGSREEKGRTQPHNISEDGKTDEYHMILFLVVRTEPMVSHMDARQDIWAVFHIHYIASDDTELLVFPPPLPITPR